MRRFSLALVCLLAAAACGNSGDDGDDGVVGDADGDGISDDHEDAPGTDTDGDGTPDFEDDDSDGDGIPDYREAGDEDVGTPPVDSDGDGTPDFRDLDSDNNGIRDANDSLDDIDGDGDADFQDQDDDGDFIPDDTELGGDPDNPVDFDGDGIGDYQDKDSDNDTVPDHDEGTTDFDEDGLANFHDEDSDNDCISDELEGGPTPEDSDGDGRFDFLDRDSDDDGLADAAEDANCNGMRDGNESSATSSDTDGDGVSDLIETAAGTDANDATDNPQANGDFVFIEPYQAPQSPTDDDLDFATDLRKVDVYLLIDRSGSMTGEITDVRNNLSDAFDSLQCPPLGTGDPADCIQDLWGGAGTVGYAGSGGQPYGNTADIQPDPDFSAIPTTEPGGCCRETMTFGAWATITGNGSATSGCTLDTVAADTNCAGSPANTNGYVGFGYPCFRTGALPVVLLATDEQPLTGSGNGPLNCPNWNSVVKTQYTNKGARLMGILGSSPPAAVRTDLETMANDTGAVDASGGGTPVPVVVNGADSGAADGIADGIRILANGIPLDLSATTTDDTSDSVNAITAFVDHLETLQLGTAQCEDGLTDQDTNGDSYDDEYLGVVAGTPVCWKVVSKQNTTVPATQAPQLFRATVDVYADDITIVDTRDVYFLVPPVPFDPPVN